jgi:hypothetical protein
MIDCAYLTRSVPLIVGCRAHAYGNSPFVAARNVHDLPGSIE